MGLTFWKAVLVGVIVAAIGIIITAIGTPLGDVLKELGRNLIAIVKERLGWGNDVGAVSELQTEPHANTEVQTKPHASAGADDSTDFESADNTDIEAY